MQKVTLFYIDRWQTFNVFKRYILFFINVITSTPFVALLHCPAARTVELFWSATFKEISHEYI